MDEMTIAPEDLECGTPVTCGNIKRGVEIPEKNNQLSTVVEVSSPIVFEAYSMVSEVDQRIMTETMADVKKMSGIRPGWFTVGDFCIQEYDKGGENKMNLYEVYLVNTETLEFDIVRLISKSRESARLKAFNMSKFADLDYDDLEVEIWSKLEWTVNK